VIKLVEGGDATKIGGEVLKETNHNHSKITAQNITKKKRRIQSKWGTISMKVGKGGVYPGER